MRSWVLHGSFAAEEDEVADAMAGDALGAMAGDAAAAGSAVAPLAPSTTTAARSGGTLLLRMVFLPWKNESGST